MEFKKLSDNYREVYNNYKTKDGELTQKIRRAEARLEKLTNKQRALQFPHWKKFILEPLSKELEVKYPGYHAEVLGPFGLDNETSIHLYKDSIPKSERWDATNRSISVKSISFIFSLNRELYPELFVRDYTQDSREFGRGTIGEMNGMNYASIPIPQDVNIQWFCQWIDKQ